MRQAGTKAGRVSLEGARYRALHIAEDASELICSHRYVKSGQRPGAQSRKGAPPTVRTVVNRNDLPPYVDLILPALRAVATLGGSAQAREITNQVTSDLGATARCSR